MIILDKKIMLLEIDDLQDTKTELDFADYELRDKPVIFLPLNERLVKMRILIILKRNMQF